MNKIAFQTRFQWVLCFTGETTSDPGHQQSSSRRKQSVETTADPLDLLSMFPGSEEGAQRTTRKKKITCAVKNCTSDNLSSPELTFHKFPDDASHRAVWCQKLQIAKDLVESSAKVCSRHFKREAFKPRRPRFLKDDADPQVSLGAQFDFMYITGKPFLSSPPPPPRIKTSRSLPEGYRERGSECDLLGRGELVKRKFKGVIVCTLIFLGLPRLSRGVARK